MAATVRADKIIEEDLAELSAKFRTAPQDAAR